MTADRKKPKKLNNAGLSLVELIVAILILAIISVTTTSSLMFSLRANTKTAELTSAENVAENLMEAVKVYGLDGTAAQVYNVEHGSTKSCLGTTVTTAKDDTAVSGSAVSSIKKDITDGSLVFVSNDTNKYYYSLTGVKEGSSTYNVKISFDAAYTTATTGSGIGTNLNGDGDADANQVNTIDLSAFNSKTTAFINPMASSIYYDAEAIEYFTGLHEDYVQGLYDAKCAEIDSANEAKMEQYYADYAAASDKSKVHMPELDPYPDKTGQYEPKTQQELGDPSSKYITREIKIYITQDAATDEYLINSEIYYVMDAQDGIIDTKAELTMSGYCTNAAYEDLKSLYFIYIPYPYMCRAGMDVTVPASSDEYQTAKALKDVTSLSLDSTVQKLSIVNMTSLDLDVYVAIQAGYDAALPEGCTITGGIYVDVTSSTDINLFSQADLTGNMLIDAQKEIIKQTQTHTERIVKATIEVYDTNGDLMTTLESTIAD